MNSLHRNNSNKICLVLKLIGLEGPGQGAWRKRLKKPFGPTKRITYSLSTCLHDKYRTVATEHGEGLTHRALRHTTWGQLSDLDLQQSWLDCLRDSIEARVRVRVGASSASSDSVLHVEYDIGLLSDLQQTKLDCLRDSIEARVGEESNRESNLPGWKVQVQLYNISSTI
ncbi:hypothetical protein JTE90_002594 [Oedothorax gibbosus]|uniref:Uncharacterized protein n=1 Tax=Oedothorax gibbosus TaxID=931172 RepID=A0AAV6V2A9_9ARAC|nr:hypothetical protein JTE90_002594 [Oedothorax gibbosus]